MSPSLFWSKLVVATTGARRIKILQMLDKKTNNSDSCRHLSHC